MRRFIAVSFALAASLVLSATARADVTKIVISANIGEPANLGPDNTKIVNQLMGLPSEEEAAETQENPVLGFEQLGQVLTLNSQASTVVQSPKSEDAIPVDLSHETAFADADIMQRAINYAKQYRCNLQKIHRQINKLEENPNLGPTAEQADMGANMMPECMTAQSDNGWKDELKKNGILRFVYLKLDDEDYGIWMTKSGKLISFGISGGGDGALNYLRQCEEDIGAMPVGIHKIVNRKTHSSRLHRPVIGVELNPFYKCAGDKQRFAILLHLLGFHKAEDSIGSFFNDDKAKKNGRIERWTQGCGAIPIELLRYGRNKENPFSTLIVQIADPSGRKGFTPEEIVRMTTYRPSPLSSQNMASGGGNQLFGFLTGLRL